MRFSFIFFLCGLFATTLTAQFGVTALYQSSQDKFTSPLTPEGSILRNGYEIAADYWFRLPTKRIEFMPTISVGRYDNKANIYFSDVITQEPVFLETQATEIGFQFKTNFYIFDFAADCDCPTWGKQGPALHKGFFIQLAPGVSHFLINSDLNGGEHATKSNKTFFNLGIGAGIDFGISNLLTITPLVSYRYGINQGDYNELFAQFPIATPEVIDGRISALQAGIRIGIRLDKRRY